MRRFHQSCATASASWQRMTIVSPTLQHLDWSPLEYIRWRYEIGEDREGLEKVDRAVRPATLFPRGAWWKNGRLPATWNCTPPTLSGAWRWL